MKKWRYKAIKVLVCGSYKGAFQKKLNQRLKKEKQEVYVLNNDLVKEKKPVSVFQDYRFAYSSESVKNIMMSVSPDVVVFCGAMDAAFDWESKNNPVVEYIAGLTNVLTNAVAMNVKKFIYISTAEIFSGSMEKSFTEGSEASPLSNKAKAIVQGEKICLATGENEAGMDVAVVRLAEVYGACTGSGVDDILAGFVKIISEGEEVIPSADACHELIYLDDAIDAVYKVIMEEGGALKAIYHIAAEEAVSEKEIYDTLSAIIKHTAVETKENRGKVSFVSTTQGSLNYVPKYSLETGVSNYYANYEEVNTIETDVQKKNKTGKKKLFAPILETFFGFLLLQIFIWFTKDAVFHDVIDVYLIYTLIIAVILGALPSTIAVGLSVIGKFSVLMMNDMSLEFFRHYENYLWILQIFALSVLTGYIRDQYSRTIAEMERDKDNLEEELESIRSINESNVEVKEVFETRLTNYKDSYAKVYDIISQLDDLESKAIIFKAASVISEIMNSKDVALYVYEEQSDYCRLMASTSEEARSKGKSFRLSEYESVKEVLMNNKIYMNRKFDENMPMFATATYNGGKIELVVMIWSMQLLDVNLHQSNLLSMLSKLMERSMSRAVRYMDSIKNSIYLEGTNIMASDAFSNMLDIYCAGEEQGVLDYMLLEVLPTQNANAELYSTVSSMTRGTDYVGITKNNALYVLLTNSGKNDIPNIIRRFEERHVQVQLIDKQAGKTAKEVFPKLVL